MKKFVLCASLWIGLFLAACGDDSSVTSPSGKESLSTLTDSRDGQTYKTVVIGKQTWMAQNLNIETEKSFCFNDDSSNCTKYGRLYTWAAAMDSAGEWSSNGKGCGYKSECSAMSPVRGVCPNGWHLPTKAEFETLFSAVGGDSVAGKMLKSTSGWNFAKAPNAINKALNRNNPMFRIRTYNYKEALDISAEVRANIYGVFTYVAIPIHCFMKHDEPTIIWQIGYAYRF